MRFENLTKPGRIGNMEIRNRIVMAPMCTGFASTDGHVTERMKDYYEERARGGAGLVIVATGCVDHPRGKTDPEQLALSDDKFIPGLAELAKAVKSHGARVALQFHYGGRYSMSDICEGFQPVAASPIPLVPGADVPKELTVEEIARIVQVYADAAERAKKAGFEAVEVHAAHGYLIDGFLSRATNKRQDAYGGIHENRARLLLEVLGAIRQRVGADYPLWCRLNGREFDIEDGTTPEEAQQTARMAEAAGANAVHVTGYGGAFGVGFTKGPLVHTPGALLPLAHGIKQAVNVPVIAVGRIGIEAGEEALVQGQADFIAMGRPLIADPELPAKVAAGQPEDIRHCIHCYTCVDQSFKRESVCCAVNAAVGREREFGFKPVDRVKKVMVIGGGPAGMEAARVAARRGHRVSLYEKNLRLGGSLFFAAIARSDNEDLTRYLSTQIRKLGVDIRLGQEATPAVVNEVNPDAVVVAIGGQYPAPPIPGIDRKNVLGSAELRQMISGQIKGDTAGKVPAWQRLLFYLGGPLMRRFLSPSLVRRLTRFWIPLGKRVVIIGGDLAGCELAEFLAQRGRQVTVLESGKKLAAELATPMRWILMDHLGHAEVNMLTRVQYEEITAAGVTVTTKEGDKRTFAADTVLVAAGLEPNLGLCRAIEGNAAEVHPAGDCRELRLIRGSVTDGSEAGLAI